MITLLLRCYWGSYRFAFSINNLSRRRIKKNANNNNNTDDIKGMLVTVGDLRTAAPPGSSHLDAIVLMSGRISCRSSSTQAHLRMGRVGVLVKRWPRRRAIVRRQLLLLQRRRPPLRGGPTLTVMPVEAVAAAVAVRFPRRRRLLLLPRQLPEVVVRRGVIRREPLRPQRAQLSTFRHRVRHRRHSRKPIGAIVQQKALRQLLQQQVVLQHVV